MQRLFCVTAGVLDPNESLVCQVTFQSGLAPQVFTGEIFCYARQEQTAEEAAQEEAMLMGSTGYSGTAGFAAYAAGSIAVGEPGGDYSDEEIIAEHPARYERSFASCCA